MVEIPPCSWNVLMQVIMFIELCSQARLAANDEMGFGNEVYILFLTFVHSRLLNGVMISHCRSCCVKPPHSFRYSSRPVWHWGCVGGGALWKRWRLRGSSCLQVGRPTLLSSYCNHSCLPSLHLPPSSFPLSLPLSPLLPGERSKAFRSEAQDLVLGHAATPVSGEHLHPCTAVLFLMGKTSSCSISFSILF